MAIGVVGAVLAVVALIAYLIFRSVSDSGDALAAWEKAEQDSSADLPGEFVPSQGRGHFSHTFSRERDPFPFCPGVEYAGAEDAEGEETAVATEEAEATPTAAAEQTPTPEGTTVDHDSPSPTGTPPADCYNSNPPSSGQHLGVQNNVEVVDGIILPRIPPDPRVYPSDMPMPREAIPHILEHAGVFVGYHCAEGDQACLDVVAELEDLVNDRIDNNDDRVVMALYPDLPEGQIGLSAWTRVMRFNYEDYDEGAVEDFIGTHSCRFDPEGFC